MGLSSASSVPPSLAGGADTSPPVAPVSGVDGAIAIVESTEAGWEFTAPDAGTAIGIAAGAGSAGGIAETAAIAAATTHPAISATTIAPEDVRRTRMGMMVTTARLGRRRHR